MFHFLIIKCFRQSTIFFNETTARYSYNFQNKSFKGKYNYFLRKRKENMHLKHFVKQLQFFKFKYIICFFTAGWIFDGAYKILFNTNFFNRILVMNFILSYYEMRYHNKQIKIKHIKNLKLLFQKMWSISIICAKSFVQPCI